MPGERYPPLTNADNVAMVKKLINDQGYDTPVVSAGKISTPEEAEGLLHAGKADMIGMARQHPGKRSILVPGLNAYLFALGSTQLVAPLTVQL